MVAVQAQKEKERKKKEILLSILACMFLVCRNVKVLVELLARQHWDQ